MPQYFPHENLEVYSHALSFAKLAAALIDSWPAVFAVCDQLDRATESIVTNLAKAAPACNPEQDPLPGVLAWFGIGVCGMSGRGVSPSSCCGCPVA